MIDFLYNNEAYIRMKNYVDKLIGAGKIKLSPTDILKLMSTELYVNAMFNAGGVANLLTTNVTQQVGITNFDGNRLETDRHFFINGVTLQYGKAESTKKPYEVGYSDDNMPEVLKSSILTLKQKGEVIFKIPVSSIENAKKGQTYYRELEGFAYLEPLSSIELQLETPDGSTIDAGSGNSNFVRVLFKGFETYAKRS